MYPAKSRSNFEISIETVNEELLPSFTSIEKQVISIDLGTELLSSPLIEHRTSRLILWLMDDEDCRLMSAIRKIQLSMESFTLYVTLHNGKKPLEIFAFVGCRLDAMQHSLFSHEPVTESIKLASPRGVTFFEAEGTISSSANRANSMKLLQIVFEQMTHEVLKESNV
jgi:hypothetical protein